MCHAAAWLLLLALPCGAQDSSSPHYTHSGQIAVTGRTARTAAASLPAGAAARGPRQFSSTLRATAAPVVPVAPSAAGGRAGRPSFVLPPFMLTSLSAILAPSSRPSAGPLGRWTRPAVFVAFLVLAAGALWAAWRQRLRAARRRETLALVAHELKSPLGALESYLDLMAVEGAHAASSEVQRWLKDVRRMKGTASALRQTLDNLMATARLESGEAPLRLEAVDLYELACQTADSLRPSAQRAGVDLAVETVGLLPRGLLDRSRIRQVLENLLSNAVKFTPRSGRVVVALREQAEGGAPRLHLSVRDTGPGIALREQGRLFKKFVRLDGAKAEGTGLGLYVCKTIVAAHGGSIWVESAAGQGSTFRVSLPCAATPPV